MRSPRKSKLVLKVDRSLQSLLLNLPFVDVVGKGIAEETVHEVQRIIGHRIEAM